MLHAEVRDVIGKYPKHLVGNTGDPEKLLEKSSMFLGEARVPLAETLPGSAARTSLAFGGENSDGGDTTATKQEFILARRHGGDRVSGFITLSFEWTITAASLLRQKLRVLEQVLTTRNEILSILALRPIDRGVVPGTGDDVAKRASTSGSLDGHRSTRSEGVCCCPNHCRPAIACHPTNIGKDSAPQSFCRCSTQRCEECLWLCCRAPLDTGGKETLLRCQCLGVGGAQRAPPQRAGGSHHSQ